MAATTSPAAVYRQVAGELLADLERTADYARQAPAAERVGLEQAMETLEDLAARLVLAAERLEERDASAAPATRHRLSAERWD